MIDQPQFIFTLSPDKKIIIKVEESDQPIDAYSECHITFNSDNQKIILAQDAILDVFIPTLHKLLRKALHEEAQPHQSMTANPGYLYNQWLNEEEANLFYTTDQYDETNWIGFKYQLASHAYASWIYNEKQGNIIFEITPVYPQSLIDQNDPAQVADYEEWMKTYQPFTTQTISKEIAQQWLEQTTNILATIDENSEELDESENEF